jgi:hypothetical protein
MGQLGLDMAMLFVLGIASSHSWPSAATIATSRSRQQATKQRPKNKTLDNGHLFYVYRVYKERRIYYDHLITDGMNKLARNASEPIDLSLTQRS